MIVNTISKERPRERCIDQGARCLSLRECIALILGSGPRDCGALGVASAIMERPGTGLDDSDSERAFFIAMEISADSHLSEHHGLGPAGKAKLLAAFELGRRYANHRERGQCALRVTRKITDLRGEALERVKPTMRSEVQEWLGFVPFYRTGQLGNFCLVERGVRTHVNIDPVELFSRLLSLRPEGFFLFHNHPSGDLTPSAPDIDLTRQVRDLAGRFGVQLLGHGIVATLGERWIVL